MTSKDFSVKYLKVDEKKNNEAIEGNTTSLKPAEV